MRGPESTQRDLVCDRRVTHATRVPRSCPIDSAAAALERELTHSTGRKSTGAGVRN